MSRTPTAPITDRVDALSATVAAKTSTAPNTDPVELLSARAAALTEQAHQAEAERQGILADREAKATALEARRVPVRKIAGDAAAKRLLDTMSASTYDEMLAARARWIAVCADPTITDLNDIWAAFYDMRMKSAVHPGTHNPVIDRLNRAADRRDDHGDLVLVHGGARPDEQAGQGFVVALESLVEQRAIAAGVLAAKAAHAAIQAAEDEAGDRIT